MEQSVVDSEKKRKKYQLTPETRYNIIKKLTIDSKPDTYYYVMVILSCAVATYGLLSNSTAVIIGAMLIAPLMNPILGSGLALITGNNPLLKITVKAEIMGALVAIGLSAFLTLLLPIADLTPEVLARTEPTLIDLIIALASGAAGTYAICYRAGATLPGVAIATALMPPLCVVGITIAKQEFQMAGGAFILFLANMLAINVIAIIIFKFAGFTTPSMANYLHLQREDKKKSYLFHLIDSKIIYPVLLLIVVTVPLVLFLESSIESSQKEKTIRRSLEEGLAVIAPDATISSMKFSQTDQTYDVSIEIDSAQVILSTDIRKLENSLEYKLTAPVKIVASISPIQKVNNESTTDGYKALLTEEAVQIQQQQQQQPIIDYQTTTPEEIIEQEVVEKLTLVNGQLDDFSFDYRKGTGTYNVTLNVSSTDPLDNAFVKTIETILEDELKRKVQVTFVNTDTVKVEKKEDEEEEEERLLQNE